MGMSIQRANIPAIIAARRLAFSSIQKHLGEQALTDEEDHQTGERAEQGLGDFHRNIAVSENHVQGRQKKRIPGRAKRVGHAMNSESGTRREREAQRIIVLAVRKQLETYLLHPDNVHIEQDSHEKRRGDDEDRHPCRRFSNALRRAIVSQNLDPTHGT